MISDFLIDFDKHSALPIRDFFSAVQAEFCPGRQFGITVSTPQFSAEVQAAGGAEPVRRVKVPVASGTFPDHDHLVAAMRAKAAV